jgi:DNA-3-methyladenine glycosylase
MASGKVFRRGFYERDPALVARELLGKLLILESQGGFLGGVIVETEAYYGLEDPASRAYRGMKEYNRLMWGEPGRVFIYNVHRYWMLNIVAHEAGGVGAVLIRALEPTHGVAVMMKNRPVDDDRQLTSGPGKLTVALDVDRRLMGADVTRLDSEIRVLDREVNFDVGTSNRIGVRLDLEKELRFYVMDNGYVSR